MRIYSELAQFHLNRDILEYRYGALDMGQLFIDSELKGSASGQLSAELPLGGRQGVIALEALIVDENNVEQVVSHSSVNWYSPKLQWDRAGVINVDSKLVVVDTISWDATGDFVYGDEQYAVEVKNSDQAASEMFFAAGNGRYQGSSVYNWYMIIAQLCFFCLLVANILL